MMAVCACAPEEPKTHMDRTGKASMPLTKLVNEEPTRAVAFKLELYTAVVPLATLCFKPAD